MKAAGFFVGILWKTSLYLLRMGEHETVALGSTAENAQNLYTAQVTVHTSKFPAPGGGLGRLC